MRYEWREDFLEWIKSEDHLFKAFNRLADMLAIYVHEHVLVEQGVVQSICENVDNVIANCDTISYDEAGAAEAYAMLHLLDRYHRWQMSLMTLIQAGALPIKQKIKVLDVGTGPAPALFAISDMYVLLSMFGKEVGHNELADIDFTTDYVEQSDGFRQFLHGFTEIANYNSEDWLWKVPFHFGTFSSFKGIDYSVPVIGRSPIKKRYDLVTFSNFLTTNDTLLTFGDDLIRTMRLLKNGGSLVVVGAPDKKSGKYKQIYNGLSELLGSADYSNYKYIANQEEIAFREPYLSYSYGDRFGQRLKAELNRVLNRFADIGFESKIEMLNFLTRTIEPDYDKAIEWQLSCFRKHSRIRKRYRV